MKLYKLKDTRGLRIYDANQGFIIAANTPNRARKIAAEMASDERASTWLDPHNSSCVMIAEESIYTERTIVLQDFLAG